MAHEPRLSFHFKRTLPITLQTESAECGLACLAMIASYHGNNVDLYDLRRRYPTSLKGVTLGDVIRIAGQLDLGCRPVKLELEDLGDLRIPAILHWDFNHFVVLKEASAETAVIHDPAVGSRRLSRQQMSDSFTGVALELWPSPNFRPVAPAKKIALKALVGQVKGMFKTAFQVILLALAIEILAVLSPYFLQWVVDEAIVAADRDLLTTLGLGFCVMVLIEQAFTSARGWLMLYLSTTVSLQWRSNVFSHLIKLPVSFFQARHLGDITSRFGSIDAIQHTLTASFLEGALDGLMSIAALTLMLYISPPLAAVAGGAMVIYAVTRWGWYSPLRTAASEQIVHAAKQQSHFLETVRGVRTIRLYQKEDERRSRWLTLMVNQMNSELAGEKLHLWYRAINGALFGIQNVIILWLGAKYVIDGALTVGVLMAFTAYKSQFDSRVGELVDKFFSLRMLDLHCERLADIVLTEPEAAAASSAVSPTTTKPPGISVNGLRYRYSAFEPYVLDGINLSVGPGESVAIVGPSGCGKTTLINVMLGLLSASEGDVLIDGLSLREKGFSEMRQIAGTVLQDDVLFNGSITENITLFDAVPDRDNILRCARLAAIDEDIRSMPMGYETLVGDMGSALSGGQKQRILLARALYKKPKILFLDEATSHLDIDSEQRVSRSVSELKITRIVVAHRPETIARADRVLVLVGGKVVCDQLQAPAKKNIQREDGIAANVPSPAAYGPTLSYKVQ